MKRIYHNYNLWEDFKSGLFRPIKKTEQEVYIRLAVDLLRNPNTLYKAMMGVINTWVYASDFNMSNPSRNVQAFLGQAACCYEYRIPEDLTMIAWNRLTETEQESANLIADIVIDEWHERKIK